VVNGTALFAGTSNGVWKLPITDLQVKAGCRAEKGFSMCGSKLTCSSPVASTITINYTTGGSALKGFISVYAPSGKALFSKEVYGYGRMNWNSPNRGSGVYFARLSVGATLLTQTMVLLN
jgi:hypothetical protein